MIRTQIQLSEAQYEALRRLAAKRQRSVAHLVREGVDALVADNERESHWDDLRAVIGKFDDSADDVAENHDEYLKRIHEDESHLR